MILCSAIQNPVTEPMFPGNILHSAEGEPAYFDLQLHTLPMLISRVACERSCRTDQHWYVQIYFPKAIVWPSFIGVRKQPVQHCAISCRFYAAMLSYIDAFFLLAILFLAVMPLILIMKKPKGGGPGAMGGGP